ncbi:MULTISPECIES: phage DNA ejection protein [Providencia]|uniref:phage DNA ejection protein n=2 Tax=Morganellaceae TaxID=1903414 RepID=UPI00247FB9C7|nr:phage DNA ejection protein [Providencia rettgeri]MDU7495880.1 phage DNA ejection protein [Providencia rettgeri]HEM8306993.1 phage DNA ejection protein [Providencia rettgeri]
MATWNQNINSGGFLGGIGQVNDNAPRAIDINPALGLIRENNDLQRSGANNWGLQGLAGLSGVAQVMNEQKQQERLKEFQGKWGQAMANNDTNTMKGLFAEYPEMEAQIGKGMEGINADVRKSISDLALGYHAAVVSGKPEEFIRANADKMRQYGFDPQVALSMAKENPNAAREYAVGLGMMAEGSPELFINKINSDENRKVTVRGQDVSAETARRGQDISAATARRGQDISASTARRGQDMAMQRSAARGGENETRSVQLSDGRTVQISGKLHGAGANAFYEGVDNSGNTVRVPANAIAAPASSSANATNYAMKKDMDSILSAKSDDLDFMTGFTGGAGDPALGADRRSRWNGGEQRQLYMAAQRIQGRMQNQGIAAARDMGASGINTVAEAKMYFQGMPQVDYSSPEAIQQSIREIQQYTDNYNSQYNVNVGGSYQPSTPNVQGNATQQSGNYSSLWGD